MVLVDWRLLLARGTCTNALVASFQFQVRSRSEDCRQAVGKPQDIKMAWREIWKVAHSNREDTVLGMIQLASGSVNIRNNCDKSVAISGNGRNGTTTATKQHKQAASVKQRRIRRIAKSEF